MVVAVSGSLEYPPRFMDAVDRLAQRDLSALTTHRLPFTDLSEALGLLKARCCDTGLFSWRGGHTGRHRSRGPSGGHRARIAQFMTCSGENTESRRAWAS